MRILVIEDSVKAQRTLAFALRKSGYVVQVAGDGQAGLDQLKTGRYDVAILDLMLPAMDGLSCLRAARDAGVRTPVLVTTAKNTLNDRIACLETGADDYLTKPFSLEELLARLQILLDRPAVPDRPVLRVGSLEIDTGSCVASYAGHALDLTPREFKVLKVLVEHAGQPLARADIEREIYAEERDVFSNVVESTISALRRKLSQPGQPQLIHTERGAGYTLKEA
jgi:DNA-binding response OmpR family regulator